MHDVRTFRLVIVDNFNARWALRGPEKANSVLVVDSNTELALPIALQGFEAVGWRSLEVFERMRNAKLIQFQTGQDALPRREGIPLKTSWVAKSAKD